MDVRAKNQEPRQMHNFKNIIAWKKAMILAKDVYMLTKKFPKEELYGLTAQIRRSVISIPSNIAEGSGRGGEKEFSRFLDIAISSSFEMETQLILAHQLGYISEQELNTISEQASEVQKLIYGFKKTLKAEYNN
jgi:four helix bundle protein